MTVKNEEKKKTKDKKKEDEEKSGETMVEKRMQRTRCKRGS